MQTESVDVLVIGAGPSGTVAAGIVHNNGFKVKIVEKSKFPRFVIGESLLPRCMVHFEEAGLLDAIEKGGFQKKLGAKFMMHDRECEFNFAEQYTDGWKWTWQVPRADFDKVLADAVEAKGVEIDYETGVTDIQFDGSDSTTTVENSNGDLKEIKARFIIDGSGYGRVIPRLLDLDVPSNFPPRSSMFTHVVDTRRPTDIDKDRIIVIAQSKDVWIWIIPFSNGNTSLGFVGNKEFFDGFKGEGQQKFKDIIATEEKLTERFEGVEMVFEPKMITGYSIGVKQLYGEGFALTGNSAEFLDPVLSSGVTFATESGALSAKLICRQLAGEKIDWENEYTKYIMSGVDVFRSFVEAWYEGTFQKIIFAPNVHQSNKDKICSVLAGYVWDKTNPYVSKHDRILKTLGKVIDLEAAV